MLPPGHAATGYLVAATIIQLFPNTLPQSEIHTFLVWGFVLGCLPDIDMFFAFAKTKSLVIQNDKAPHRRFITHTPFFWLIVSAIVFLITQNFALSLLFFLCPLSHFFLDSIEDEIRWLWPFSKKLYRMKKSPEDLALPPQNFFSYWKKFIVWYVYNRTLTASLEVALILRFLFLLR